MYDMVARIPLGRHGLFILLAGVILAVAAGHLFMIPEYAALYFGVPLWLWAHILVVVILLGMAWVATGLMVDRRA